MRRIRVATLRVADAASGRPAAAAAAGFFLGMRRLPGGLLVNVYTLAVLYDKKRNHEHIVSTDR